MQAIKVRLNTLLKPEALEKAKSMVSDLLSKYVLYPDLDLGALKKLVNL